MYLYHFIRLLDPRFLKPVYLTAKFQEAKIGIFHGIGDKSTLQIQPLCICSILSPMQYKIIY